MKSLALIFVTCVFFILSITVSADIPKLINYQGMLTDDEGNPLTGSYNLEFLIYDDTTGGDLKWSELQNGVQVENGLFNVVLGSQTVLNIAFDESYWLAVKVGTETLPRIRITSVGYAYWALVADSARVTTPGAGSHWSVNNSVLYTNEKWGIARGGVDNALYGYYVNTHVNLGAACTTGTSGWSDAYCTVGGGDGNTSRGNYAVVAGGRDNRTGNQFATVGGGLDNNSSGDYATIGGGNDNMASGSAATVAGGAHNIADETKATVGGGSDNIASEGYATVAGGRENTSSGYYAAVGGGYLNTASGGRATVPGGSYNTATGNYSLAAGRRAKANHLGTFVWADSSANADFASTGKNQFLIRASGGVGIGTNSPEEMLHVQNAIEGVIKVGTPTSDGNATIIFEEGNDDALALRYNGSANELRIDDETQDVTRMVIERSGKVGIGMTDPTEKLDVNGTARLRGISVGTYTPVHVDANGKLWKQSSSRRYKQNIRKLDVDTDKILELSPVRFQWKTTQGEDVGLIAEDLEQVLPELVVHDEEGRPDAVKYDKVALYLLELVKAQQERIATLEKKIAQLENR